MRSKDQSQKAALLIYLLVHSSYHLHLLVLGYQGMDGAGVGSILSEREVAYALDTAVHTLFTFIYTYVMTVEKTDKRTICQTTNQRLLCSEDTG